MGAQASAFDGRAGASVGSRRVDRVGDEECDAAEEDSARHRYENDHQDPQDPRKRNRVVCCEHRADGEQANSRIGPILRSRARNRSPRVEPPQTAERANGGDSELESQPIDGSDDASRCAYQSSRRRTSRRRRSPRAARRGQPQTSTDVPPQLSGSTSANVSVKFHLCP
jgi:hypothetical protein